MKVGAAVVTCRRGGNTASFDVLNKYLSISSMSIASSQYWNMVYGGQAEEVLLDTEGLQTMRTLGRNIAFMVKSFAPGKKTDFECHQMEHRLGAYTNCNHGAGLAVLHPRLITDTSARQEISDKNFSKYTRFACACIVNRGNDKRCDNFKAFVFIFEF